MLIAIEFIDVLTSRSIEERRCVGVPRAGEEVVIAGYEREVMDVTWVPAREDQAHGSPGIQRDAQPLVPKVYLGHGRRVQRSGPRRP